MTCKVFTSLGKNGASFVFNRRADFPKIAIFSVSVAESKFSTLTIVDRMSDSFDLGLLRLPNILLSRPTVFILPE